MVTYSRAPKRKLSKRAKSKIAHLRRSHGRFWKEARKKMNLTQKEVAATLGYESGQFISNVESGRCRYPGLQLPKIQKLYGLKTSDILAVVLEEEELALRQALGRD